MAEPTITPDEASNKILGLVAGARIACKDCADEADDKLTLLSHVVHATKTGEFDMKEYIQKIAATKWNDASVRAVCEHALFIADPMSAIAVSNQQCTLLPLIAAAWLGFFNKWDDYAIASTMCMSIDSFVLSMAMIIASTVRSMITGLKTNLGDIIPATINHIVAVGNLKQDDPNTIKLGKYLTPVSLCGDVPPEGPGAALWALWRLCESRASWDELIAAVPPSERALTGALLGAELGLKRLDSLEHNVDLSDVREFLQNIALPTDLVVDNDDLSNELKEISLHDVDVGDMGVSAVDSADVDVPKKELDDHDHNLFDEEEPLEEVD